MTEETRNSKPDIIEFYSATKWGVDTFEQMCQLNEKTNAGPCEFSIT